MKMKERRPSQQQSTTMKRWNQIFHSLCMMCVRRRENRQVYYFSFVLLWQKDFLCSILIGTTGQRIPAPFCNTNNKVQIFALSALKTSLAVTALDASSCRWSRIIPSDCLRRFIRNSKHNKKPPTTDIDNRPPKKRKKKKIWKIDKYQVLRCVTSLRTNGRWCDYACAVCMCGRSFQQSHNNKHPILSKLATARRQMAMATEPSPSKKQQSNRRTFATLSHTSGRTPTTQGHST